MKLNFIVSVLVISSSLIIIGFDFYGKVNGPDEGHAIKLFYIFRNYLISLAFIFLVMIIKSFIDYQRNNLIILICIANIFLGYILQLVAQTNSSWILITFILLSVLGLSYSLFATNGRGAVK